MQARSGSAHQCRFYSLGARNLSPLVQESFETADLRTLTDDEIKPHSQHPLPGLSRVLALPAPAQPKAELPLPAVPAVPAVAGATADQVMFCHEADEVSTDRQKV